MSKRPNSFNDKSPTKEEEERSKPKPRIKSYGMNLLIRSDENSSSSSTNSLDYNVIKSQLNLEENGNEIEKKQLDLISINGIASPPPKWLPTLPISSYNSIFSSSSSSSSFDNLPFLQQPSPLELIDSHIENHLSADSQNSQSGNYKSEITSPSISSSNVSTSPPLTPDSQYLPHPLGMNGFASSTGGGLPSPTGSTFTFTSSMQNAIFREDEGRLYNATQDDYGLPADNEEIQRLDIQHHAMRLLFGGNYLAHVGEHLRRNSALGKDMRVLDLGCGTGTWCLEMSREFPEAEFIGVDLVPIQPDNLPNNCSFMIDDITNGLSYPDGMFDLVTGRLLVMGLRDYPSILQDIARVIKPGGMYVATEPDIDLILDNGSVNKDMKGWKTWERGLQKAMKTRGTDPHLATKLYRYFTESGVFNEINVNRVNWPLTPWSKEQKQRNVGTVMIRDVRQFPDTSRLLIIDAAGISPNDYDRIKVKFLQELEMNYKISWHLWTCWGKKRA